MKPTTVVLTVIAALAIATGAAAQSAAPPGVADPVTIKVSRQSLLTIGQALQELPAKLANPILNDLQAQLNAADEEVRKKAEAAKPAEGADKKPD